MTAGSVHTVWRTFGSKATARLSLLWHHGCGVPHLFVLLWVIDTVGKHDGDVHAVLDLANLIQLECWPNIKVSVAGFIQHLHAIHRP